MNYITLSTIRIKFLTAFIFLIASLPMYTTHYINNTGRDIKISNVSAHKRNQTKKRAHAIARYNIFNSEQRVNARTQPLVLETEFIMLEKPMPAEIVEEKKQAKKAKRAHKDVSVQVGLPVGQEGDLDNQQGDEITITSPGMSDKRRLFPTNNSFNYVITMNKYAAKFEKFDVNHAG